MAILDANLLTLNDAVADAQAALRTVLNSMAAGEELRYTSVRDVTIGDAGDGGPVEVVGTVSGDGEVLGDFALHYPVDNVAGVSILLDAVAVDVIDNDDDFAGAAQQCRVVIGLDNVNSGQLQFGINGAAAIPASTPDITAVYTPGKSNTLQGPIVYALEDEAISANVQSPRNNTEARNRFRAILGGGIYQSDDSA